MMNEGETLLNSARVSAQLLINNAPVKTPQVIRNAVNEICSIQSYKEIDRNKLVLKLEMENNLVYNSSSILDSKEHKPWLYPSGKPVNSNREIKWKFWEDYKLNIMQKGWPHVAVDKIDEMSTQILMRLEDPVREGTWKRYGMVVGDVQSGKTASYTGLICKAADSGYKIIVVFSGLHDSLRSQTQQRLDDDFIGFDSSKDGSKRKESNRIGVGKIFDHGAVHYVTTGNDKGDFSRAHANKTGLQLATRDRIILIVKKNKSIINNLRNWAVRMGKEEGHDKIRGVPLLVIDDECDNASVNTGIVPRDAEGKAVEDHNPSAINKGIREFLNIFEQSAYIGYTATPFANILIHVDDEHPEYGKDLFPGDFIINLPVSGNYIGPDKVFGMDEEPELGIEASQGYPLYRIIEDYKKIIPDKHNKNLSVCELPLSMKEAIKAFILSCASKNVRGYKNHHNSMLIHVTRFTAVQNQITELVRNEIKTIKNRLRYGDGSSSTCIWDELKKLWHEDFIERTSKLMETELPEWESVKSEILISVEKIHIKEINGVAGDILEYKSYRDTGINVIAIGGDKLSRGLTFEGLSVSYYLRSSRMYDTLMQMGRWFGYRDGYLDLCRIYTTDDLMTWYRHIALATIELRREFDYMVENDEIPENYGLKIRSHPGALSVTAFNKMRNGTKMKVTYDGYMAQTLFIYNNKDIVKYNFMAVENLIKDYTYNKSEHGYIFENVTPDSIKNFLTEYKAHERNISWKPGYLIDYIDKLNKYGELIDWTVVVLSKKDGLLCKTAIKNIDGYLNLTTRTAFEVNEEYICFEKALLSSSHEKIDLTDREKENLKEKMEKSKTKTEPPKLIRSCRPPERGLLLIYPVHGHKRDNPGIKYGENDYPVFGYVVSFPDSGKQRKVEYIVNSLYPDELEVSI